MPATFDPGRYEGQLSEATLEILPRWGDVPTGLEEYSHLLVIFWFDRVQCARKSDLRSREGRRELPEVSLFATCTPRRANPFGVSAPHMLRREGCRLWVTGIDARPGTPVLDIKAMRRGRPASRRHRLYLAGIAPGGPRRGAWWAEKNRTLAENN